MDKKYQIFVSSTFRDLNDERQDAIRNILDLNHIPAGMELFPAADLNQLEYIKKVIDECDYYVLIIGARYGSVDAEGISYTEREYDYAVAKGKTVLAFVHADPSQVPVARSDIDPKLVERLVSFKRKVMEGRLVKSWKTRQELELVVLKALTHAFTAFPQIGWVRGNRVANETLLAQANAALEENAELRKRLSEAAHYDRVDINGLVGLDDEIDVRFATSFVRNTKRQYTNHIIRIKLKQIFVSLAGDLEIPKTDHVIFHALKLAAAEIKFDYVPESINEMDKNAIKAQFQALGLISCSVSKTTQGGIAEFLSLTPKGRAAFIEAIVLRKNKN